MNETVLKQQYLKCYQIFLSFTIYHILIGLENLSTSVVITDLYLYWSIIFPAVSLLTLRTVFVSSLCVVNIYSLADHDSFFIIFLKTVLHPSHSSWLLVYSVSWLAFLIPVYLPSPQSILYTTVRLFFFKHESLYDIPFWEALIEYLFSSLDSPACYWRLFTFWLDILPLNYLTLISCVNVLLQSDQSLFMSQRYFGPFLTLSFILFPSHMPVWILSIL